MHHQLKAHPDSFSLLALRKSEVQLRRNDRGYRQGDSITFYEWMPDRAIFTGRRTVEVAVVEVLDSHEGLAPGWCLVVLALPETNICRQARGLAGRNSLEGFEE